ncbi:MAG: PQQ-binding-like beta-propeller repeat protein [Oscillospiraceae bacterium]|nr:PQQ-binding-like beta-propeller repeat protein [Oscillospiraceae bacterium]
MSGRNRPPEKKKRKLRKQFIIFVSVTAVVVIALAAGLALLLNFLVGDLRNDRQQDDSINDEPIETPAPTPTEIPSAAMRIPNPQAVDGTRPEDFGLQTSMLLNNLSIEEFHRQDRISFGDTNNYTDVDGIVTFRGNNFRDTASYGSIGSFISGELEVVWLTELPEVLEPDNPDRAWAGMGWTGQPLIAKWNSQTRSNMNITAEKIDKTDLKEVIFGTMGGAIHFLDLEDGRPTRDTVEERWPFRGAGALDPRGYPFFYVGSGNASLEGNGQNLIYNLTDTTEMFNYGEDDEFRRRNRQAFGGSTMVNTLTDTVTYPSESNIIYQFSLNSSYDPQTGIASISPTDMLRWRYSTARLRSVYGDSMTVPDTFSPQYGFDSSPAFWREFMYIGDNAGNLFCININTFEVIWMNELPDDIDASPVLEIDELNGRMYLYIGHAAHFSRSRNNNTTNVHFYKIDAVTGERVWTSGGYRCLFRNNAGGIRGTAALGKNNISDLVIVPYSNVINDNGHSRGTFLVAHDKISGEEVWNTNFGGQCSSSPVDVYDDNGNGYIVFATAAFTNNDGERIGGFVHLIDGRTGERLGSVQLQGHVEASPVVYDNMIVIGTQEQMIYGIRIS